MKDSLIKDSPNRFLIKDWEQGDSNSRSWLHHHFYELSSFFKVVAKDEAAGLSH